MIKSCDLRIQRTKLFVKSFSERLVSKPSVPNESTVAGSLSMFHLKGD